MKRSRGQLGHCVVVSRGRSDGGEGEKQGVPEGRNGQCCHLLYIAVTAAVHHNPETLALIQRLREKGNENKVAS